MGSGTVGLCTLNRGLKFIGCELDTDRFKIAKDRIRLHAESLQNGNTVEGTANGAAEDYNYDSDNEEDKNAA